MDENGVVHAVAAGRAAISALTAQPQATARAATVQVTVNQAVTGMEPESAAITVPVKKSVMVRATVSPREAANKKLDWSSEDENIAAVNANGQISGKGIGTTVVTAKAADGKEKKGTFTLYVAQDAVTTEET